MKKYIITFGSGQLTDFNVRPNKVALIVEGNSETEARDLVINFDGIGKQFCTSYNYEECIESFVLEYNMIEYTLADLDKRRI